MAKVLDWGLEISEFEIQSRYHIYFRNNASRKFTTPLLIPPVVGQIVSALFFYKDGSESPTKIDMSLKQKKPKCILYLHIYTYFYVYRCVCTCVGVDLSIYLSIYLDR